MPAAAATPTATAAAAASTTPSSPPPPSEPLFKGVEKVAKFRAWMGPGYPGGAGEPPYIVTARAAAMADFPCIEEEDVLRRPMELAFKPFADVISGHLFPTSSSDCDLDKELTILHNHLAKLNTARAAQAVLERNDASGLGQLSSADVHRREVHEHVRMLEVEERLIRTKVKKVADDTRKEVLKDLSPANENEVTRSYKGVVALHVNIHAGGGPRFNNIDPCTRSPFRRADGGMHIDEMSVTARKIVLETPEEVRARIDEAQLWQSMDGPIFRYGGDGPGVHIITVNGKSSNDSCNALRTAVQRFNTYPYFSETSRAADFDIRFPQF
jgi:hypothetical protein